MVWGALWRLWICRRRIANGWPVCRIWPIIHLKGYAALAGIYDPRSLTISAYEPLWNGFVIVPVIGGWPPALLVLALLFQLRQRLRLLFFALPRRLSLMSGVMPRLLLLMWNLCI